MSAQHMSLALASGTVAGALIASALSSDWRIPRRLFDGALAAIIFLGLVIGTAIDLAKVLP